ncbi:hypothetical protein [Cyanobium sp. ATX-6F1]|uniref:hypothetical protein n=1 Tax=Cyanobium sp. ATX-6F1 TaxID=3137388 RepID=UPI0039BE31A4
MIAAAWGVYTFIYKDIWLPSQAPAHINLEITLTPVETGNSVSVQQTRPFEPNERLASNLGQDSKALIPTNAPQAEGGDEVMTVQVSATNPSSRKLYLLSNYWQLFGIHRRPVQGKDSFITRGDLALRAIELEHAERGVSKELGPTLAVGRLFDDDTINPGETIKRSMLVRIPPGYEAVQMNVAVPVLTQAPDRQLLSGKRLEWSLNSNEGIDPMLCRPSYSDDPVNLDSRGENCKIADPLEVDRGLKSFDQFMRVFSASEQVAR